MASVKEQKEFIEYIAPVIQKIGNERGYNIVSVFIAMACKEGNFGQSSLAKKYHNHFGMKAGSSWKGKVANLKTMEEYTVGKLTQITDGFRVYEDDIAGVNGFFDFISTKRYAKVKEQTTPLGVVSELKSAGYCTSSTYVNSVMSDYIKKFDLERFDSKVENNNNSYPTLSLGCLDSKLGGKYIESWQNYLYSLGMLDLSKITIGNFDTSTYFAVRQYQESKGLKNDGIIGIKTWKSSPAYKE